MAVLNLPRFSFPVSLSLLSFPSLFPLLSRFLGFETVVGLARELISWSQKAVIKESWSHLSGRRIIYRRACL